MYLLVIITRQEEKVSDFLRQLPAAGISGATVVEGKGMGKILQEKETVFTSLEQILSGSIDLTENVLILSVIPEEKLMRDACSLAHRIFGDFSSPNTGVLFVLPVLEAEGLAQWTGK